jgi:hypothetical protein
MDEKKIASKLADEAMDPKIAAKRGTLGAVMAKLPKRWTNWGGDMSYVTYGGVQAKFDGHDMVEMIDLTTPDGGYPGWILSEDAVFVFDLFENRPDANTPFSQLEPTSQAIQAARFVGEDWEGPFEDDDNGKKIERFLFSVILGWKGYYGFDHDVEDWRLEDYGIDDIDDIEFSEQVEQVEEEIEKYLKKNYSGIKV